MEPDSLSGMHLSEVKSLKLIHHILIMASHLLLDSVSYRAINNYSKGF